MSPTGFLIAAADRFEQQCLGVTEAQWVFRPRPGAWSMGDVAEHVTIATGNIARRLRTLAPLGKAPDIVDEEIPYLFYRGDEPPNVATPTGTWTRWTDHADAFRAAVAAVREAAAIEDLRARGAAHPVFGTLDGVQWLIFAGAHIERHRSQLIGLAREASAALNQRRLMKRG
jgi:hypothetical protein